MASTGNTAPVLSISLPSALKPALVSVHSPWSDNGSSGAENNEQRLRTTQDFYTPSSSGTVFPQRTRTSFGPQHGAAGAREGARLQLPSILPHSTFLKPRKPTLTPRNSSGLLSPQYIANARSGGNDGGGEPNMYLDVHRRDGKQVGDGYTSTTSQSENHRETSSSLQSTGWLDGKGPARGGSIGHRHSLSRQGTIASRTSREPLILQREMLEVDDKGAPPRDRKMSSQEEKQRIDSKADSLRSHKAINPPSSAHLLATNERPLSFAVDVREGGLPSSQQRQAEKSPFSLPLRDSAYDSSAQYASPVLSEKTGRPLRNYQVYEAAQAALRRSQDPNVSAEKKQGLDGDLGYGSNLTGGNNRFYCAGRLISSGESPFPLIASFAVTIFLPAIFLAFESQWLWSSSSPTSSPIGGIGGTGCRAVLIIFAYCTLIMWSSMLRTSFRDPGIIVKGLDREPDWETFAVPIGGLDDMTGTGVGQRIKPRMIEMREVTVSSKCK